jgi:hypothetical protein
VASERSEHSTGEEAFMPSLGVTHLLVLVVLVVLVFDSRRLHGLTRSMVRSRHGFRPERGIPPGANPDQVGLPLRQIQMRKHVDWQDGGIGWGGPEVLPVDRRPEPARDAAA